MKNSKRRKILDSIFGSPTISGSERIYKCPACSKHKLSVNVEKGVAKCWTCSIRGKTDYIVSRFGDQKQKEEWLSLGPPLQTKISSIDQILGNEEEDVSEICLPEEYKTLSSPSLPYSAKEALQYLYDRGITQQDIRLYRIGYCAFGSYSKRIIVPSFNDKGELDYFIGRSYVNGDQWRYKNPKAPKDFAFNELYINWKKPLLIVEGVFDLIKADVNAVPVLGSSLQKDSYLFKKIIENDTKVILAFDEDAQSKERSLCEQLLTYGVKTARMEVSPFSDVGEMPREEIRERMERAEEVESRLEIFIGDLFK